MPSIQQYQYQKSKSKGDGSGKVVPEAYANLIFREAFNAPFTALQQGEQGRVDLNPTWAIVTMAAYMQEKVCVAWGKLDESELVEGSDYRLKVKEEEDRLSELVIKNELSREHADARLAYFKLSEILKRIQATKGVHEELEV